MIKVKGWIYLIALFLNKIYLLLSCFLSFLRGKHHLVQHWPGYSPDGFDRERNILYWDVSH